MSVVFPVPEWIGISYKDGMRQFGWRRDGGKRLHAGCDLYAPLKSAVKAIADGEVVEAGDFYLGTQQIAIRHEGYGIIRYGEIYMAEGIKAGDKVSAGDEIGKIGHLVGLKVHAMLHFEQYDGTGSGKLSLPKGAVEPVHYNPGVMPNGGYRRRADLMNPTELIDMLVMQGRG